MNLFLEFGMRDVVAWGDVEACLFMTPLKTVKKLKKWLKCESSIRYERKLQFSSNSFKIGLSSVTHRVSTEMEELDEVDGGRYPWIYSD